MFKTNPSSFHSLAPTPVVSFLPGIPSFLQFYILYRMIFSPFSSNLISKSINFSPIIRFSCLLSSSLRIILLPFSFPKTGDSLKTCSNQNQTHIFFNELKYQNSPLTGPELSQCFIWFEFLLKRNIFGFVCLQRMVVKFPGSGLSSTTFN